MLIAHLQDRFPDYLTVSPPIGDLQAFYKVFVTNNCDVYVNSWEAGSANRWLQLPTNG